MEVNDRPPILLLMKGHPGTGKSTLASSVARALRWSLIDKDDIRDALEACLASQVPAGALNTCSYDAMWRLVGRQLSIGNSAVVDCPLARRQLHDTGCSIAAQHGASVAIVETTVEPAVWRHRLEVRGELQEASCRHKPASWEQLQSLVNGYSGSHEWPKDAELQHYLVLDTTYDSVSVLQSRVTQYLTQQGLL